jgi:putative FmdB family regulatory protein
MGARLGGREAMPTYEYQCDACGHEFEREQRISDDPIKTCPECRARKARRLISRTSFVLKGGGWYSDLYSSSSPGGEGDKKEKPADSDSPGEKKKPAKGGGGDKSPKKSGGGSSAKSAA